MSALYGATPAPGLIALYAALLAWGALAHVVAAVSGLRVLSLDRDRMPPRPMCLIIDATRWALRRPMSAQAWRPRDFMRLAVFVTVATAIMQIVLTGEAAFGISPHKPPPGWLIREAALSCVAGSALIIIHCGIALHLAKERKS